jgi:hypothetical protein
MQQSTTYLLFFGKLLAVFAKAMEGKYFWSMMEGEGARSQARDEGSWLLCCKCGGWSFVVGVVCGRWSSVLFSIDVQVNEISLP